ncbi:MAG: VWA domain-containing protein [Planctomycetaceae bacterium]|nr:VWA domain-containing protein [Planctomycetaceae bacterium]
MNSPHLKSFFASGLFHLALLLLMVYQFSSVPATLTTQGERYATGGILLKIQGEADSGQQETQSHEQAEQAVKNEDKGSEAKADGEKLPDIDSAAGFPAEKGGSADGRREGTSAGTQGEKSGGVSPDTVRLFDTEGKGSRLFYVFDRSGSMDASRMRKAKKELLQSIRSLKESHQFNILFYSGRSEMILWQPERKLIFAAEIEKERAGRFVAGILPEGGTRHCEPLLEALRHRPDVIFFLTDGERQDDLTLAELNEIRKANRSSAQINVIQFGQGSLTDLPSEALQSLAEQNGGQYQYIIVKNEE